MLASLPGIPICRKWESCMLPTKVKKKLCLLLSFFLSPFLIRKSVSHLLMKLASNNASLVVLGCFASKRQGSKIEQTSTFGMMVLMAFSAMSYLHPVLGAAARLLKVHAEVLAFGFPVKQKKCLERQPEGK